MSLVKDHTKQLPPHQLKASKCELSDMEYVKVHRKHTINAESMVIWWNQCKLTRILNRSCSCICVCCWAANSVSKNGTLRQYQKLCLSWQLLEDMVYNVFKTAKNATIRARKPQGIIRRTEVYSVFLWMHTCRETSWWCSTVLTLS